MNGLFSVQHVGSDQSDLFLSGGCSSRLPIGAMGDFSSFSSVLAERFVRPSPLYERRQTRGVSIMKIAHNLGDQSWATRNLRSHRWAAIR